MTKVLSTQEKTFRFFDTFNEKVWCDIHIVVEELQYENGNVYYMLKYENTFSNPDEILKGDVNSAHPFYGNKTFSSHVSGDIVVKNLMTENMVNYLLMNTDELSVYTGTTSPMTYRANIMKMITMLWD